MTDEGNRGPPATRADQALLAVRRSVEAVQELLDTNLRQAATIGSLHTELISARERLNVLEQETTKLRTLLGSPVHPSAAEIEALIEEQNTLAHLFVASDRLARVQNLRDAIDVAVEILHNLAGVHRYALWLRGAAAGPVGLRLVAPAEARYRSDDGTELRDRAMASKQVVRAAGVADDGVPVAYPLMLDDVAVGAIVVSELVPQVGGLGRLQDDLLRFLSDRLAAGMCDAALRAGSGGLVAAWATLTADLPDLAAR